MRGSLEDYLARFEYTIPLLQTPEAIERVAYEMVEDAGRDGIRYLEVRYCPRLSTRGGLAMEQALEAELRGLGRGERDFGVVTRVINCSLRHYAPEVSVEIAAPLGGLQAIGAWWRSTSPAARPGVRPARTPRPSISRRRRVSASRSTRARRPEPTRSPTPCTTAMPTGSGTAPGCTRIPCCATTSATGGS